MRECKWIIMLVCVMGLSLHAEELWDYPGPDPDRDQEDLSFYEGPEDHGLLPFTHDDARPKNVIVLIGDGMGFNFVQLGRLASVGAGGRLHMERMPVTGIMRTHSDNNLVTDSAAAATAMATGVRTRNQYIGMGPDKTPYKSVLQVARDKDYLTGLAVNVAITHATPAPFASHVEHRRMGVPIASQLLDNRVDVLFGGGRRYFLPEPDGRRQDDRNLLEEAEEAGYSLIYSREQLLEHDSLPVLGLFAHGHMSTFSPEPMLDEKTRVALRLLKDGVTSEDRPGFFLMIEGGQIDWAGHANDTPRAIRQMLKFDMAVKEALDFAREDGETLVIVTADHETGGLMITGNFDDPQTHWATGGHTASDVPIYAYGPGAMRFAGTRDITEIALITADLLGIKNFPVAIEQE